jgi:hypothetical protein
MNGMSALNARIVALIQADQWGLTWHTNDSIQERAVEIWQIVGLTLEGRLLREVQDARPRPKVEIEILLPDGTPAKVVWAYDAHLDRAILITVHFFSAG